MATLPGATAQLLAAAGIVATLVGLMAFNALLGRGGRVVAPAEPVRTASGVRYVTHRGRVLGAVLEEKEGRLLLQSGGDRLVVDGEMVKEKDGEWELGGELDMDEARRQAGSW